MKPFGFGKQIWKSFCKFPTSDCNITHRNFRKLPVASEIALKFALLLLNLKNIIYCVHSALK